MTTHDDANHGTQLLDLTGAMRSNLLLVRSALDGADLNSLGCRDAATLRGAAWIVSGQADVLGDGDALLTGGLTSWELLAVSGALRCASQGLAGIGGSEELRALVAGVQAILDQTADYLEDAGPGFQEME